MTTPRASGKSLHHLFVDGPDGTPVDIKDWVVAWNAYSEIEDIPETGVGQRARDGEPDLPRAVLELTMQSSIPSWMAVFGDFTGVRTVNLQIRIASSGTVGHKQTCEMYITGQRGMGQAQDSRQVLGTPITMYGKGEDWAITNTVDST